jgi:hypothetical protein
MLPALLLLIGLVQPPEPRLFLWTIIGLGEPGPNIVVTVTPTPFGLVSGVEVKAIELQPSPTRDDPRPRTIQPTTTEPAPRWGLQASFPKPGRRFNLTVTFSDGSVHDVDVYAPPPPDDRKEFRSGPLQLISHRANWGD